MTIQLSTIDHISHSVVAVACAHSGLTASRTCIGFDSLQPFKSCFSSLPLLLTICPFKDQQSVAPLRVCLVYTDNSVLVPNTRTYTQRVDDMRAQLHRAQTSL